MKKEMINEEVAKTGMYGTVQSVESRSTGGLCRWLRRKVESRKTFEPGCKAGSK